MNKIKKKKKKKVKQKNFFFFCIQKIKKWYGYYSKWSFRRFTYGNLVTTSPSSKAIDSLAFGTKIHWRISFKKFLLPAHRKLQSVGATGGVYRIQGRIQMHADDMRLQGNPRWRWIIANIYPKHGKFWKDFPFLSDQGMKLAELASVARVQPRTSKGITDLVLPSTSYRLSTMSPSKKLITNLNWYLLFSRQRSRSLTELTRQITSPTKTGHAPLFTQSRKSCQSVNPKRVWTW